MHKASGPSQLDVACELLDRALCHYFDGNSDFAALAGAAEELLGKFLRARNRIPIFENLQDVTVRRSRLLSDDGSASSPQAIADLMNHAKNHLKHSTEAGTYDARAEAHEMLERALSNYHHLLNDGAPVPPPTSAMQRFDEELALAAGRQQ